jgi:4-hydroxy-tetrahydrodipicolinate reductase
MRIALIGYGRMGHEIETQALARDHEIMHRIDKDDDLQSADFSDTDVAIEFTHPDTALANFEILSKKGVATVTGTTGWFDEISRVQDMVKKGGTGFLWSPNFSIGVNLFLRMIDQASKLMNAVPEYDVFAHEFHHNKKADSPSGTAVKMGNLLLKNIDRKKELVSDKLDRAPEKHELHFSSTRGGNIPGTHAIFFDSPADTIELKHTARNRSSFALGAVMAAEWLKGKKGCFEMDDFLSDFLQ